MATAAAVVLAATAARGQLAEAGMERVPEFGGPQDLPGREQGPRTNEPSEPSTIEVEPDAPRGWFGGARWREWQRATGDWGGVRTTLEEAGLTIEASYTMDWSSVWSGGIARRASTRHLFDMNATLDLDTALGWTGATLYADFYAASMRGGSRDVGDWQWFSNVETDRNGGQLAEAWLEQRLWDDAVRVKVGKVDANMEFGFVEAAAAVLNASAAYSPTIAGMTTYPDPSFGAVVFVYPTERLYVGGGVFDGATMDGIATGNRGPDTLFDEAAGSWFFIAEGGVTWEAAGPLAGGRAALGVHHHTAAFARYDDDVEDGASGVYALVEQALWTTGEEDERGVWVFVQAGWASAGDVERHCGGGVTWRGPCEQRPCDVVGLYVTWIDLADEAGTPYAEDETAIEVYWKIALTGSVSVTPEVQVILNPGGDASLDDAVVGQVRFEVVF
ncbi:MAG: porin [Phycisphaerae bacterium]|nr:MAG: porin [Phycisphaerae bacterium]